MDGCIPRENYLEKLRGLRDLPLIKVITGMRRTGKSTLMMMFREEVVASGTDVGNTCYINLGDETDMTISTPRELMDGIKEHLVPEKGTYVFLDEVQNVDGWERVVESLFIRGVDVYVTGSNSRMLSSEISTKLSGRYVEVEVLPLSFSEYLLFRESYGPEATTEGKFSEYIRWGGLPVTALMSGSRADLISMMISGTYNTVFIKDVIERNRIRNPAVISNVSRFMMGNIGNRTSPRNASGFLVSKGMKASTDTIDSYIGFLEDARLFTRARRMDSKTKEYLHTSDKFYVTDIGMRNVAMGYDDRDIDGVLENIVFMELIHRYGNASVMDVDGREVDLVSYDPKGEPLYFQVSVSITDPNTMERELRPLRAIRDNYPKAVVTMDRYPYDNVDGIRIVNVVDFLTERTV